MLTDTDIKVLEKSIRKIVREEVTNESEDLKSRLESELKSSRMRIQIDIRELTDRLKNSEIRLTKLEKINQEILKNVKKIRKDLDTNIILSDRWVIYLDKRIRVVESDLKIKTPEFA